MGVVYISVFLSVLILSGVDYIRIKIRWGATGNIKHAISGSLAFVLCAVVYHKFNGWHFGWQTMWFGFMCVGMRGVFYDPFLNKLLGLNLDHVSSTSSSLEEQRLNKVGFWQRRIIFGSVLLVSILAPFLIRILL